MRAKLNYMLAVFLREEKCVSACVYETKKNAFVAISIQTDLCCRLSSASSFEFVFLCFIACTQKLSRVIFFLSSFWWQKTSAFYWVDWEVWMKKSFSLSFFLFIFTHLISTLTSHFSLSTATRTIKKEIPLQKFLSKIFTYIFRRCYVVVEISSLFSFSSSEDGVRRKMVLFARTTITGCNISIFSRPLPWK